jgi:hypothetical protein
MKIIQQYVRTNAIAGDLRFELGKIVEYGHDVEGAWGKWMQIGVGARNNIDSA